MKRIFAMFALAAMVAHTALAAEPAKKSGDLFVNASGMTLYVFDKDAVGSGKSVCNSTCATNWPPFAAPADAKPTGDWTVITRDDGSKQWAYKGRPLYTWVKDQKPGDTTGDGIGGNWHVAK